MKMQNLIQIEFNKNTKEMWILNLKKQIKIENLGTSVARLSI